jgi:hypothetical protein
VSTKRVRILGLCLLVACAFLAVSVASAASAAEFGECVGFKHGSYLENRCGVTSEKKGLPAHKGAYEFEPADSCYAMKKGNFTESGCKTVAEKNGKPDHKGSFESTPSPSYTSESGPTELITPGFAAVKCSASSGAGLIEGGTTTSVQTSFTGCESSGQKCQNTATEGNIVTFPLSGTLTEPETGRAETVLKPASGAYLAEFACTGVASIRTGGTVGGRDTPTNMPRTTTSFEFEKGVEQGLETEFSGSEAFGAGETEGPFSSEQVGVTTNAYSTSIEILVQ